MCQIFGKFIEDFPPDHDALELSFTPTSQRIRNLWRSRRLSAHFLADYFTSFLPLDKENPDEEQRIKETKGAISYISNELLENAMKFNLATASRKVRLGIHFIDEPELVAVIFAVNSVSCDRAKKFQTFIQDLLTCNTEDFYMRQVEASVEDENAEMSGLGFLTMMNDYQANLGWRFERISSQPEIISVTSMAQVPV